MTILFSGEENKMGISETMNDCICKTERPAPDCNICDGTGMTIESGYTEPCYECLHDEVEVNCSVCGGTGTVEETIVLGEVKVHDYGDLFLVLTGLDAFGLNGFRQLSELKSIKLNILNIIQTRTANIHGKQVDLCELERLNISIEYVLNILHKLLILVDNCITNQSSLTWTTMEKEEEVFS